MKIIGKNNNDDVAVIFNAAEYNLILTVFKDITQTKLRKNVGITFRVGDTPDGNIFSTFMPHEMERLSNSFKYTGEINEVYRE